MTPECGIASCGDTGHGGYSAETPGFLRVFPSTARSVTVVFNHSMLAWRTLRSDDTCNPTKWLVEIPAQAVQCRALAVVIVAPGVFEVFVDRDFADSRVEHRVTVSGVLTCSRDAVVGTITGTFNGMAVTRARRDADLFNQTGVEEDANLGTFAHMPDGDVRRHYGSSVIRKIVMRYVMARKDSYKRLYPDFRGAMPALKSFITVSDLVALRAEVQSSLTQEVSPNLRVSVSLSANESAIIVTVDGVIHTVVVGE